MNDQGSVSLNSCSGSFEMLLYQFSKFRLQIKPLKLGRNRTFAISNCEFRIPNWYYSTSGRRTMTVCSKPYSLSPPIANKAKTQPQVCQVIACINEQIGGPALSVTSLAETLAQQNIGSHLFTLDYPWHGRQVTTQDVYLHSSPATAVARYFRGFQPSAQADLQQLAATELDLIHNHGLWMFPNIYARQAAQRTQLPLVISPRGMLEAWSLSYGQIKKWLAWQLYEQKNLRSATVFHATSEAEVESIRSLGFQQAIAMIPNGVNLPNLAQIPARDCLIQAFPELADRQWLLFLSRIHPKKGLDTLLQVWQTLAPRFPDWQLVIAGPDVIGYQAKVVTLATALGVQQRVTFTGMLSGKEKAAALGNADLFVLPTHSENFGIAIAESLAYTVPVITTKGTPWQDLQTYECGWWIDRDPLALTKALDKAMQLSPQQRRAMGLKGRELVESKYSWTSVGQQMAAVYQWILAGGTPPDWVTRA
jgi:glycosyltransferase involved in cell wall biosynthesis